MKVVSRFLAGAMLMLASLLAHGQQAQEGPCSPPASGSYFPARQVGKPAVLVFIHGVMGDPVKTWLDSSLVRPNVFWPCLVRRHPAFADANLYLAGYTSSMLKPSPTVEEAADALFDQLETDGVLKDHSHVGFVVHSLGGLEVIRMIARNKHRPEIAKVRFVRFYGTPAKGSEWAGVAALFSQNAQFPKIAEENALEAWRQEWAADSTQLGIRSFCAAEQQGVGIIFKSPLIVQPESAAALCGGRSDKVWLDHLQMVKPRSTDDDTHRLLASSYARCIAPRIFAASQYDVSQTTAGQRVSKWFRGFAAFILETARNHGDVVAATKTVLHGTEGFWQNPRYNAPRAGMQSLALVDNELADANSFAKVMHDQLITQLAELEVEAIVPLSRLGEALSTSDAYELSRRLQLNGGFASSDLVLMARTGTGQLDRVLFFIAPEAADASRPQALLRGFALAARSVNCGTAGGAQSADAHATSLVGASPQALQD